MATKHRTEIRASLQSAEGAPPANTYAQLRADIRAESARLIEERKAHWYDGLDLATINDLRRIDNRRQLLVEIDLLIDKFEAAEKEI